MRIQFDKFELDTERRELFLKGAPTAIPPKAFDVLENLVENRDRMVTKRELMDRFWSVDVSEAALAKAISQIRRVLSATKVGADAIRTSYGLGYSFNASVSILSSDMQLRERHWATVLVVLGAQNDAAFSLAKAQGGEILTERPGECAFVFGAGQPIDDASRRAVYCAEMLRREDHRVCSGVATVRLNVDDSTAGPEEAAKALARRAGAGIVLIDEETRVQLRDEIKTEEGAAGYALVALFPPHAGVRQRLSGMQTCIVGRESEMAFLTSRIAMLGKDSGGQAILLTGPPGIGKTRLLGEFLRNCDVVAPRIERLHCLPALGNTALAPIRALCRALFPSPPTALLKNVTDEALYAELSGGVVDNKALAALSDHERDQRLRTLLFQLVQAEAVNRTLVISVEDVHWIDASSRACLDYLVQRISETRVCIVMTTRPVDGPTLAEVVLPLAPLSLHESLKLLRDPALSAGFEDTVAQTLVRRAAGNPFFIEELARAAQAGGDPAVDLPQTIQAVIALRISALDASARQLLLCAAVIGAPAPLALIAHLIERSPTTVEAGLTNLIHRDFLREEPDGFVFRHMLIQDTAYDMLAVGERRRLHGLAACILEETGDVPAERLAHHHQEAGQDARAAICWRDASRAALHRSARNEAITFAHNGIRIVKDTKLELDLQLCLAPALTALQGFGADAVGAAYARAEVLLADAPQHRKRIRVFVGLWIHTWVRGRLSESLDYAAKILQIAENAGDASLNLQAFAGLGQVQFHLGEMQTAHRNLTAGLAAIKGSQPPTIPAQNAAVSCAAYMSWTEAMMGREMESRKSLAHSLAFSVMRENSFAEAIHYALATGPLMLIGDVKSCLEHARLGENLSREHGFSFWLGTCQVLKGWCLGQEGRFDAAFDALDEGIDVFEATDAGVQVANFHGLRAEVLLAAGRLTEGLAEATCALALAEAAEDLWFTPRIHATMTRLFAALGRDDDAATHSVRAQALVARFGIAAQAATLA